MRFVCHWILVSLEPRWSRWEVHLGEQGLERKGARLTHRDCRAASLQDPSHSHTPASTSLLPASQLFFVNNFNRDATAAWWGKKGGRCELRLGRPWPRSPGHPAMDQRPRTLPRRRTHRTLRRGYRSAPAPCARVRVAIGVPRTITCHSTLVGVVVYALFFLLFFQASFRRIYCISLLSITCPRRVELKLSKPTWSHAVNPPPPSDAFRKQKKMFWRIFSVQYCHTLKNITPLETRNLII